MSLEQAFLDDILANPEDDTPRLIYADWLDDHGNHDRAEFIRLQIELAGMREDDPRHFDSTQRQYELVNRHEQEWLGPLHEFAGWHSFRRGFVHNISLKAEQFRRQAPQLFRLAPIRELSLSDTPSELQQVVSCEELRRVRRLSLGSENLDDSAVALLVRSPHLTELEALALSDNRLTPAAAESLARHSQMPRLIELDVSSVTDGHNLLRDEGVRELAGSTRFPALKVLKLQYNEVGSSGLVHLAESPLLKQLHTLQLYSNRIGMDGIRALTRTSASLVDLNLGGNRLPAAAAELLASWPSLATLRSLDLSFNELGAPGLKALAGSSLVSNLESLDVSGSRIIGEQDESGLVALVQSPHLRSLKSFELYHCRLGSASLEAIGKASWLANLTALNLGANPLGASGMQALIEAPFQRSLRELRLGNVELGAEGLGELMRWPCSPRLTRLHLWENDLGADAMRVFASWPDPCRLSSLDLWANEIGDEGAEVLAGMPQLRSLTWLDLWENNIEGSGALALAASPHLARLASLTMHSNPVGDRGQAALVERFGNRVSF